MHYIYLSNYWYSLLYLHKYYANKNIAIHEKILRYSIFIAHLTYFNFNWFHAAKLPLQCEIHIIFANSSPEVAKRGGPTVLGRQIRRRTY